MRPPDFRATGVADEVPLALEWWRTRELEAPEKELAVVTNDATPTTDYRDGHQAGPWSPHLAHLVVASLGHVSHSVEVDAFWFTLPRWIVFEAPQNHCEITSLQLVRPGGRRSSDSRHFLGRVSSNAREAHESRPLRNNLFIDNSQKLTTNSNPVGE